MSLHRRPISVIEAQNRMISNNKKNETESVDLIHSFGRILAEEIAADHPIPPFRRSGMDGFAIRSEDTLAATVEQPVRLEIVETIPSGSVPKHTLHSGQAAQIMTGAVIPDGADAVIMLEWTKTEENNGIHVVCIHREIAVGDHITPIGNEVHEGTTVLQEGEHIGPGETAILATFGYATVRVYKKPRVAILATGSELLQINQPIEQGKIRNSNSVMIASLVDSAGGIPLILEQLTDDLELVQQAVQNAFSIADLVITTGGVSVGDYDVLSHLFESWDGEMLFNKVAMRPGSPTTAGVWKDKLLLSLSGNPGACFVGFELFARPILYGMQGKKSIYPAVIQAHMMVSFDKPAPYARYVRAASFVEEGKVMVQPVGKDKSSIMVSIKDADCLVIIPPGGRGVRAGELVDVMKLM